MRTLAAFDGVVMLPPCCCQVVSIVLAEPDAAFW
jgi:hypothetical protein